MAPRARRALWIVTVLAMAVIVLGVFFGETVWLVATTRRVVYPEHGEPTLAHEGHIRGWYTVRRFGGEKHGLQVMFYEKTGFIAFEGFYDDGRPVRETHWNYHGKLIQQVRKDPGKPDAEWKSGPPWWWDKEDQVDPTAPWWEQPRKRD